MTIPSTSNRGWKADEAQADAGETEVTLSKTVLAVLVIVLCGVVLLVPEGGKLDGLLRGKAMILLAIFALAGIVRVVSAARGAKRKPAEKPK